MKNKRRNHSAQFKAKVALAARIRPARRENLYRPIDLLLHGIVECVQYLNLVRYVGT